MTSKNWGSGKSGQATSGWFSRSAAISAALLTVAAIHVSQAATLAGRTVGSLNVSARGEAMYSLPLTLPGAIKGMAPSLSLAYGHRRNEGIAGIGWVLSGLSSVTRCYKTVAQNGDAQPIVLSQNDAYCLDGVQLRLTSGTWMYGADGSTYRGEVGAGARVTAKGAGINGPSYWTVEQKNGLIYEYGNSTDSAILSLNPNYLTTPVIWALSKIRDRQGNQIVFTYQNDGAPYGAYRIQYIDYASNPGQGVSNAPYRVTFNYETQPAADKDTHYIAGGQLKDTKRLTSVEVRYTGDNTLVHSYTLAYESTLSVANRSRLASIQECASTGPSSSPDCYTATTFGYQNGQIGLGTEVVTTTQIPSPAGLMAIDFNGDKRTDIVYPSSTNGTGVWKYRLANPAGTNGFDAEVTTTVTDANFLDAVATDYNQDGRDDILQATTYDYRSIRLNTSGVVETTETTNTLSGTVNATDDSGDGKEDFIHNTNSSMWSQWGPMQGGNMPGFMYIQSGSDANQYWGAASLARPQDVRTRLRRIDFNGDGNGDFPAYQYFCGWTSGYCWTSAMIVSGKNWTSTQIGANEGVTKVITGDWNGDGLTDVVHNIIPGGVDNPTGPEAIVTRVSNGYSMGPAITLGNSAGFDLGKAVVIDWNGDGRDDLIVPNTSTGTWWVFLSDGENLTAGVDTALATNGVQVAFAMDINGDGLMDLGYVNGNGYFAYRLHSGNSPDLLASVTDSYGNVTSLAYGTTAATSTNSCYVQDTSQPTFPVSRSIQTLITLCKTTASDGVGSTYNQSYTYYNNNRDLQGRGALGFEKRAVTDSRNSVASTDYYSQTFPYTGLVSKRETNQGSGTLMDRVINTYSTLTGNSGFYLYNLPYLSTESTEKYEVGGTQNGSLISTTALTTTMQSVVVNNTTGGSDTYGRITNTTTSVTEAATANGIQAGAVYTKQQTRQNFQDDAITNWCIDIPGQLQIVTSHSLTGGGAITRTTGQTWDVNNCRLTQTTVEPGNAIYQVATVFGYDGFGNKTSQAVTGAGLPTRTNTTTYNAAAPYYGRFATGSTDALNEASSAGWEPARGVQLSATDPNGLATNWQYDAFHRRTLETRSDGTSTLTAYQDCSAVSYCVGQVKTAVTATVRSTSSATISDSKAYFDKFDRPVEQRAHSLSSTAGSDYSVVLTQYDALGNVSKKSAPCLIGACATPYWTTNTYDLRNRITLAQTPVSQSNSTLRNSNYYYEGLTIRLVDANNKQTKKVNNVLGSLVRTEDANGYAILLGYDSAGSKTSVADSLSHTLTTSTYDYGLGAFTRSSTDTDLGAWTYTVDALGEVTGRSDAKGQQFSTQYDALSRPIQRRDGVSGGSQETLTTWTWGNSAASHNIGQLQSATTASTSTYTDTYSFDSLGRRSQWSSFNTADAGGTTNTFNYTYNASTGLLETVQYPTSTSAYRLKLLYTYQNGQLLNIKDYSAQSTTFWAANTVNARGQYTQQTMGNGVITNRTYDAVNGWMSAQTAGVGGGTGLQNDSLLYDYVGNVTQRQNNSLALTESFCYDNLYRLDYSVLGSGCGGTQNLNVDYDAMGDITVKSDVGTYDYTTAQAGCTYYANAQLHAVRKAGSTIYCYDANGNMTRRGAATNTIAWTSYNYPSQIVNSSSENVGFLYGPSRQRWRTQYVNGATTETTYHVGNSFQKVVTGSVIDYRHYIYVDSRSIAVYSRQSTGANTLRYVLEDHQGSVANIVTSTGASYVKENFSAYGSRRNPSTWSGAPTTADLNSIAAATREGYTWQTALGNMGLNHMNGRVQDAVSGRFLSADPYIPDVENTQEYNRFAYVTNNPMTKNDPTGFEDVLRTVTIIGEPGGWAPIIDWQTLSESGMRDLRDQVKREVESTYKESSNEFQAANGVPPDDPQDPQPSPPTNPNDPDPNRKLRPGFSSCEDVYAWDDVVANSISQSVADENWDGVSYWESERNANIVDILKCQNVTVRYP